MANERYVIDVDGERHIVDRRLTLDEERAKQNEKDRRFQERMDAHWTEVLNTAFDIANENGRRTPNEDDIEAAKKRVSKEARSDLADTLLGTAIILGVFALLGFGCASILFP